MCGFLLLQTPRLPALRKKETRQLCGISAYPDGLEGKLIAQGTSWVRLWSQVMGLFFTIHLTSRKFIGCICKRAGEKEGGIGEPHLAGESTSFLQTKRSNWMKLGLGRGQGSPSWLSQ